MEAHRQPGVGARFGDVDAAGDPDAFVAHLDRVRAQPAVQAAKARRLAALGLRTGERVLEVGCGTGEDTQAMARLVGPSGSALGVDRSELLLAEAVRRGARAGSEARFEVGDAERLSLPDACVDAVYAERVLQHVASPGAAVHEAWRVLVGGGRVLVAEQDWGSLVISSDAPEISRRVADAMARAAAHGSIGTDLVRLLRAAGFADARVEPAPVLITSFAALGPLVRTALADAVAGGLEEAAAEAWLDDLRRRDADGVLVAAFLLFEATARKPAAVRP